MIANLEAEKVVIAMMLTNRECCASILAELDEEHFTDQRHRKAWRCGLKLAKEGKPVDIVTVTGEMGEVVYLTEVLIHRMCDPWNISAYMDSLREARRRREVIMACEIAIRETKAGADGYLDRLQKSIASAGERAVKVQPVGDEAKAAVLAIGKRENRVKTGFNELDSVIAGLRRSDMMVIGARPSVGKTSFAMNIALNVARHSPVAFFSLEMDRQSVLQRAAYALGRCSQYDILRGSETAQKKALAAAEEISKMRLYIDDRGGLTAEQIRAECLMIKSREPDLEMIVVDYLGLMQVKGRRNGTRENEVAEVSRSMKRLAMELKVPVVLLSQLSREIEKRAGEKIPRLSDLRESGAIEQDADVVVFLHRPAAFDSKAKPKEAYAIVAKNRNGACRSVELVWHGEWFLFEGPWVREAEYAEVDYGDVGEGIDRAV